MMDWLSIIVCVVIAALALKFLKLVGKIISIVFILIAVCVFLNTVFGINVIEVVGGFISGM